MKKYAISDEFGNVLRWGLCSNATFESRADVGPGEKIVVSDLIGEDVESKYKIIEKDGVVQLKPKKVSPVEL